MMHSVSSVSARAMTTPTVGMAIVVRMTAGMAMKRYSSQALPCDCSGIAWPRSRNFTTISAMNARTMTPTMPATKKIGHCRSWIIWAFSPAGFHVS
jgi:hypothetical protein